MALVDDILGCPLLEITRSYWAVKLTSGKWRCQRERVHNWRAGEARLLDWMDDIAATGDCERIEELWLLCPPNQTAPLGNTARLPIPRLQDGKPRPKSCFQFNIGTADGLIGRLRQTHQAQIIGRIENRDGDCICFAWDPILDGMLTYQTPHPVSNDDGSPYFPLQTNVLRFGWRVLGGRPVHGMWRDSLAPPGKLAIDRLGVKL